MVKHDVVSVVSTHYHTIRKAIYVIHHQSQWRTHPAIAAFNGLSRYPISPPPVPSLLLDPWITELASLAKQARIDARQVTTKRTQINYQKAIAKYRTLLNLKPRRIYQRIFKNIDTPPLDCLCNRAGNILINLVDISEEIFNQQSLINRPTIPLCLFQPTHLPSTLYLCSSTISLA
jgi:hypothetical protein